MLHQLRRACAAWFNPADGQTVARGMPQPLSPEEKRPAWAMDHLAPQGMPRNRGQTVIYDRGAQAFAWESGILNSDPIGEGWIPTKPFTNGMRKTGDYLVGSILWNTTPQNMGAQPALSPLLPPAYLYAIFGQETGGAIVAIPNLLAPGSAGFGPLG
jgi:hypothetical protein